MESALYLFIVLHHTENLQICVTQKFPSNVCELKVKNDYSNANGVWVLIESAKHGNSYFKLGLKLNNWSNIWQTFTFRQI